MLDIQIHDLSRDTANHIRLCAAMHNRAPEDEARIMVEMSLFKEELEETHGRLFRLLARRLQLGEDRERSIATTLARGYGFGRRAPACD